MLLPLASLTVTDERCSGRNTSGIVITGFSTVLLSSTKTGITPYIRIGRSLTVCACGCKRVTQAYTLGDISLVAGNFTTVCPCWVSTQKDCNIFVPDSI